MAMMSSRDNISREYFLNTASNIALTLDLDIDIDIEIKKLEAELI